MESNLITKVGGDLQIKKSVLRNLIMRSLDSEAADAVGYLLEVPHTGNYVSVSKVSDLLKATVGRENTSKLLYSCTCEEEDLPDIMLEHPGSLESEIAAARLHMPDAPVRVGGDTSAKPSGLRWPSALNTIGGAIERTIPASRAARASALAAKTRNY